MEDSILNNGTINKASLRLIMAEYGSPLFIVSEKILEDKINEINAAFSEFYPNYKVFYSMKTNNIPGMLTCIKNLGIMIEVVSGYEYWLAKKIGYKGGEIIFNGPHKTDEEIKMAIEDKALVHIDNCNELERIAEIASRYSSQTVIGIRVNIDVTNIDRENGLFNRFPIKGSWRFGFNIDNREAYDVVREIENRFSHLNLKSIHINIGTHIKLPIYYLRAAERVYEFIKKIENDFGINISQIDFGGGYYETQIHEYVKGIASVFAPLKKDIFLIIEPGTYIVKDAVTFVATVLHSDIKNGLQKVTVDGSSSLLFTANFSSLPVESIKHNTDHDTLKLNSIIFGNSCVSSDILSTKVELPKLNRGDLVAFPSVGAYTISRSEQFIFPRPAVLLLEKSGKIKILRRKEMYDDMVILDNF